MDLLNLIIEPMSHEFMQRALFSSIMIGLVCSIFSCFLILKGWSLMGDAVSHAVLPGIAIAYVLNFPLAIGAFVAGLLCSISTVYLKNHCRVKEDAIMGIVFSGMFAFGTILLTKIETDVHLLHVLFGNILGISQHDFIEIILISSMCVCIMMLKREDYKLFCFDPSQAYTVGLSVKWLNYSLLILLSLTIVSALKAAGIILVIAMLITPGAIGLLLSKRFNMMLLIAISTSTGSCVLGTLLSYHFDTSTAPLMVLIQSSIFILVLFYVKIFHGRYNLNLIPK